MEKKIGAEGLVQRMRDAEAAIRISGRNPIAVRMNTRTARFLLWHFATIHGEEPPRFDTRDGDMARFQNDQGKTMPIEVDDNIPDGTFGWSMGGADQIGPGGG